MLKEAWLYLVININTNNWRPNIRLYDNQLKT